MSIHCSPGGGGGLPGGNDTEVQYNDGGAFNGDPAFVWDDVTETLTVSNASTLGDNFIVNGTFDADTDWTKTGDAAISAGEAQILTPTPPESGTWSPSTPLSISIGKQYLITFDAWVNVADLSFTVGGFSSPTINADGSYAYLFTASATTNLTFTGTITAFKIARCRFDNVVMRELGNITGYIEAYGVNHNSNVTFLTDYAVDFGTASAGLKRLYLGVPASGSPLPNFSGLVQTQHVGGDFYIGNDNVFNTYYVQKTVVSGSVANDNTEDYTNLYQGDSAYQLVSMMYAIEKSGTLNGVEIGAGAVDATPLYIGGTFGGFQFYFDKPNGIMNLDGDIVGICQILQIELGGVTPVVRPATNDKIDLGDLANNLMWKDGYFAGAVDAIGGFAVNTVAGHTGWFDDGVNFRVTVTGGIITNIQNSIAGGWA
jgi:hypothetical protein